MKKWMVVFACILLIIATNTLTAQDITLTSWTRAQYLGVNGSIFLDNPVIQTDLGLRWDNLYANIWWSVGLDDSDLNSNFGDEVDLTLGWAKTNGRFTWDTGLLYLEVVNLCRLHNDFVSLYANGAYELNKS
jgi:hypothetical protein